MAFGVMALLGLASVATADMSVSAVGYPLMGGSWFQDFHLTSNNSFTRMGIALTNPDATPYFGLVNSGPPAIDFSAGGTPLWFQTFFGPFPSGPGFIATAFGVPTDDMMWRSHFADPLTYPFTMTVFAYDDLTSTTVWDKATATWDGTSWSYGNDTGMSWVEFQSSVSGIAPVPSAFVMALAGMGGVTWVRRRLVA